jgi:hypothetical protein
MNMKGTPSKRMLKNEIEKSCKLNVNQLITGHAELKERARAPIERCARKRNGDASFPKRLLIALGRYRHPTLC